MSNQTPSSITVKATTNRNGSVRTWVRAATGNAQQQDAAAKIGADENPATPGPVHPHACDQVEQERQPDHRSKYAHLGDAGVESDDRE